MSRLLTGIESQTGFPWEDLSEENANILSLWLSNEEMLSQLHRGAENIRQLYRLGHIAILAELSKSEGFSHTQIEAAGYGIAVYEATSTVVAPRFGVDGLIQDTEVIIHEAIGDAREESVGSLDDVSRAFREQEPQMTEVVAEIANRFTRKNKDYAIAGAALSRRIELESLR